MKLQKIIERLQKLHPKEIDLSLDRIKNLCKKLYNPQDNLNCISVIGTNGKYSTIQAIRAILVEANIKCNVYTSPHVQKINERFIYDNNEIEDDDLANLLREVEEINNNQPITFFEILTAAFFYRAKKFANNITLIETGLFHKFDATNILKNNLASVITAIGLDHLDWLPKNEQTIDKIIFEKTSSLLNSNIIVSKQSSDDILNKIKTSIKKNKSKKFIFNNQFSYLINENNFFYYKDKYGGLKLPYPNLIGQFQLTNISTAIATLRSLPSLNITDEKIKKGITKIKSIARLQEIKNGKLKNLVKNNKLFVDGSHNPLGAKVLADYLDTLNCKKHVILGMMANKNHNKYISCFKNKINSLTTVDIPNQKNAIERNKLKNKLNLEGLKINSKPTVQEAISSIPLKDNEIILITGSLYLAGEVLNLN
jgi:dihydrofolate synthase/folylpolyglutamate synthase